MGTAYKLIINMIGAVQLAAETFQTLSAAHASEVNESLVIEVARAQPAR